MISVSRLKNPIEDLKFNKENNQVKIHSSTNVGLSFPGNGLQLSQTPREYLEYEVKC